jgi:hypothetical protein
LYKTEWIPFFSNNGIFNKERVGCVYIGAIDFRFYYQLLSALAFSYPDINFDIYGPFVVDVDKKSIIYIAMVY